MTLNEYLATQPLGAQRKLCKDAKVSPETIRQLRGGRAVRDKALARRISKATNGRVPVWKLMKLRFSDVAGLCERANAPLHRAANGD